MVFTLTLFGSFRLTAAGLTVEPFSTLKARTLLAFLALNRAQPVRREALGDLLWPESDAERSRGNLKTALWSIRRNLAAAGCDPDAALAVTKHDVRWIAPIEIDVERLERAAAGADAALRRLSIERDGGDFLAGDFGDWAVQQRERYTALYERLVGEELARTRDPALAELLLEKDPYQEFAYVVLLDAAIARGNFRSARATYDRALTALAELQVEPSPELRERLASIRSGERASDRFELPFVGRHEELSAIEAAWERAWSGAGEISIVAGGPGMGKTALVDELERRASRLHASVLRLRGRVEDPSYGPWPEAYESLTGRRFEELVSERGRETPAALADLAASHLGNKPLLVLDDAQKLSADALQLTRDAIGELVLRGGAVVIATRPEKLQDLRASLAGLVFKEYVLGPLHLAEIDSGVRRAAGQALPQLSAMLHERTAGYPLFLASLLLSLEQSHRLLLDGMRWTFETRADRAALPVDVASLFESRLREPGADAFRTAGVLGLEPGLQSEDVAAILDVDEAVVLDAIDDFIRLGILVESDGAASVAFAHDVVREVAVSGISASRRRSLHRQIAKCLERRSDRGIAARRAHHLAAANEPAAAAAQYLAAAQESQSLAAWNDAAEACESGLAALATCAPTPATRDLECRLLAEAAGAQNDGGRIEASRTLWTRALQAAREAGAREHVLEALIGRAFMSANLYQNERAMPDLREALQLAIELDDKPAQARALYGAALSESDFEARVQSGERGYRVAVEANEWNLASSCAEAAADVCIRQGWFDRAHLWVDRCVEAAERYNPRAVCDARYTRAFFYYMIGRLEDAKTDMRAIVAYLHEHRNGGRTFASRDGRLEFIAEHGLGNFALRERQWDVVIEQSEKLERLPWFESSAAFRILTYGLRVQGYLGRAGAGDLERAADLLTRIPQSEEESPIATYEVDVMHAQIAMLRGEPGANELFDRAMRSTELQSTVNTWETEYTYGVLRDAAARGGYAQLAERAEAAAAESHARFEAGRTAATLGNA